MDSNRQMFLQEDAEMEQNFPSERKRKRTPKEPWEPKSKGKEIMSEKPKKLSGKGKRTRICDIYNNVEDQYICMERAGFFLERLDTELPRFAKCMLPSNVLYSFWLILPKKFCVMHLPMHDATITLVDESGKEFKTNFLKDRHGLSAGWRGFSCAQRLLQGDILFFHLVGPCKLQVDILRRNSIEVVEAASCLMEMLPRTRRTRTSNFEKEGRPKKEAKTKKGKDKEENAKEEHPMLKEMKKGKRTKRSPKKCVERPPLDISTEGDFEDGERVSNVDTKLLKDQCDISSHSEAFSSEDPEGSTSEMINQLQPDELSYSTRNLCYHEGINCQTAARRVYASTIAT